ncbi:uncharacterized protein LOC111451597 [Cucurbita moschata]|uniref:Uncharacterized protein LOC111451597 n=1 Tax=Cucurbita moschata TaxID=3662 RepID=A0A6J1G7I6_CUCMO|nr:uncharacterized protein LOC111451597 [Cucurbita moschata]
MMKEFEMTNLRLLTYYLSIEVDQRKDCIMLKQSTYAKKLLQQLKMAECNSTKYPMVAKYLTRTLRYMKKYTTMHHQAVKHILRYVKVTTSYELKYQRGRDPEELVCFTDSDLAGDIYDRKSIARMTFYLNGNLISWQYQKQ